MASLQKADFIARLTSIPAGETSKSIDNARKLYAWLAEGRAERRDVIVALGGGVVGDLAGMVAATYVRGMTLVHVPTTVLAMADSSIGGKVAIDLPEGKNLVGAFHQPALVLADVRTLRTLPPRERIAGFAEVVKTALIMDAPFVDYLEHHSRRLMEGDEETLRHALARCAALKGRVVSLDERETTGLRAILNYGHTLGHALEAATGYISLLHGEAVAIGMAFAGALAQRTGLLSTEDLRRQSPLLTRFGLPQRPPADVSLDAIHAAFALDKKVEGGKARWVLLDAIGHAALRREVPTDTVEKTLQDLFAGRL